VKDLRLGTLVGTRTSGIVSGPAAAYLLDDASLLTLPAKHELSADHELINGIGVAPDYYLRSLHKISPPDTTPTSPRHSLCSAANPHQPNGTEAAGPAPARPPGGEDGQAGWSALALSGSFGSLLADRAPSRARHHPTRSAARQPPQPG
jgi:hypothetical protein